MSAESQRPCCFKALRTWAMAAAFASGAAVAKASNKGASAACAACCLAAGLGLTGVAAAGLAINCEGKPRAMRISSAHTGTAGKGALPSSAANLVTARASKKACHTKSNCSSELCKMLVKRSCTQIHPASLRSASACWRHWVTSDCKVSRAASASFQGLVESTSMRWAKSTATSRCTCTLCCKSSMLLARSSNWIFKLAKGSRDSGAPALAASRCQTAACSAENFSACSSAWALAAHSSAIKSWSCVRRISSKRSRSKRLALLSRLPSSLSTSCNCAALGLEASQVRKQAARSPEVSAEKAPPVRVSKGWISAAGALLGVFSMASDIALNKTLFSVKKESPRMGSHPGRILKNSSAGAGTGVGLGGIFAPKRVAPKLISTNVRCRGS